VTNLREFKKSLIESGEMPDVPEGMSKLPDEFQQNMQHGAMNVAIRIAMQGKAYAEKAWAGEAEIPSYEAEADNLRAPAQVQEYMRRIGKVLDDAVRVARNLSDEEDKVRVEALLEIAETSAGLAMALERLPRRYPE
jgi:hypothetical protein